MNFSQPLLCFHVKYKTRESSLDCKEIQPVHPKRNQSWVFSGRTDVKAETPILWPPDVKSWLIWKDPDAGKDWGQEEKRMIEDEMVGWHHRLNGHEFGWTPGVGDGQGGLACCGSWGCKESDKTERLKWTELNWTHIVGTFTSYHCCIHQFEKISYEYVFSDDEEVSSFLDTLLFPEGRKISLTTVQ